MRKGIGPYGLGAPKAVGKQITKDKIIKGAKEAGKFISNPGAYVTGKIITQIVGTKGAGATTPKKLPAIIAIGGKEAMQEAAQEATKKPSKGIADIKKGKGYGKIGEGGKMMKQKKYLKRKPVEPVNELKRGGLTKLKPATPRADAKLQKLTPAKPKPQSQVAKPKKVKIKVKPNKTKIKIKN